MDLATLIGLIIGIICVMWGMFDGGDPSAFFSLSSIVVTVGGGLASTIIAFTLDDFRNLLKVLPKLFRRKEQSPYRIIQLLVELSQKARREGLLALESNQEEIEDEYLRKALELVVDGVEPEIIRDSMQLELDNMSIRHGKGIAIFKTLAAEFPAWGMIGTLLGLINLLRAMDDPSQIGAAMSLALVTTFYGSILANMICIPAATKLQELSTEEIRIKEMIIEGVLSIQSGENPRIMEHRLKTFLSPEQRADYERTITVNGTQTNRIQ